MPIELLNDIECPHCGENISDVLPYSNDLEGITYEMTCYECDKDFWAEGSELEPSDVAYTYKTKPREFF